MPGPRASAVICAMYSIVTLRRSADTPNSSQQYAQIVPAANVPTVAVSMSCGVQAVSHSRRTSSSVMPSRSAMKTISGVHRVSTVPSAIR